MSRRALLSKGHTRPACEGPSGTWDADAPRLWNEAALTQPRFLKGLQQWRSESSNGRKASGRCRSCARLVEG